MLTSIPVFPLDRAWHVGTFDRRRRRRGGLEGSQLSVSWCPEAWDEIARLSGATWEVTRNEPGLFLDARAVSQRALAEWGISRGLVRREDRWCYSYHDDELDDTLTFAYETRAEALEEVSAYLSPRPRVRLSNVLASTQRLLDAVGGTKNQRDLGLALLPIALAQHLGLAGVWWTENYDPVRLSAPRGCILAERVAEWDRVRVADVDYDEELLEAFPAPKRIGISDLRKTAKTLARSRTTL
jgi:hypothetical protein